MRPFVHGLAGHAGGPIRQIGQGNRCIPSLPGDRRGLTRNEFIIAFIAVVCRRGTGNGRKWIDNAAEQLRAGGYDEPVRSRGQDQGHDRVRAYRSCSGGAAGAGLSLRPTELLIFGNARGGTPLMEANQTIGIDLPLKWVLVWQDASGVTLALVQQSELGRQAARPGAGGNGDSPNHGCDAECAGGSGDHKSIVEGLDLASLP